MSVDRELLLRYLRQQRELGGDVLWLEAMTRPELSAALRAWGGGSAPGGSQEGAASVETAAPSRPPVTGAPAAAPGAPARTPDVREPAAAAPVDWRAALADPEPAQGPPRGPGAAHPGERTGASPPGDGGAVRTPTAGAPPTVSPPSSLPAARAGAAGDALRVLGADAAGCTRCGLAATRRHVVFGEGAANADLVIVGEAPGRDEDASGRPFVGRAGQMLDLLLMAAGFPRERVYICNVLKCRPPENRDPRPDEVSACTTSWLHAQLEAIAPRALLAVGKFAGQTLAGAEDSLGRLRGRIHTYRGTPLVVTYHPAYLLRSPHMVRTAWQDVQLVRKVLDEAA